MSAKGTTYSKVYQPLCVSTTYVCTNYLQSTPQQPYIDTYMHSSNLCSSPHLQSQMSPWKHPVTPFEQPVRELFLESEVKRAQQSRPQLTTHVYTVHTFTYHKTHSNQSGSVHKAYVRTYSSTGRLCYCTWWIKSIISGLLCVCVGVHVCEMAD